MKVETGKCRGDGTEIGIMESATGAEAWRRRRLVTIRSFFMLAPCKAEQVEASHAGGEAREAGRCGRSLRRLGVWTGAEIAQLFFSRGRKRCSVFVRLRLDAARYHVPVFALKRWSTFGFLRSTLEPAGELVSLLLLARQLLLTFLVSLISHTEYANTSRR